MKKNRNFLLYLLGRFVSFIGTGIQLIALPLYILDQTGSGVLMGLLSILSIVPALIMSPFSGVLGDRKNRKEIMIIMDYGRGGLICFLGILATLKNMNIYIIFVAQVFISLMDSLFNSSSAALMPELLQGDEYTSAYSLRGSIDGISQLLGPVLGGILYGLWGIKIVFYINGISFVFSGICLTLIVYKKMTIEKVKMTNKIFMKEAGEIITFIKKHKGIMQITIFAFLSNALLTPLFDIIMPYVIKKRIGYSSQQFGYLFGCLTIGTILGNLFISKFSKKFTNKTLMKTGFFITPTFIMIGCTLLFPMLVSFFHGASWTLFTMLAVCCGAMGFAFALVNTTISTNTQKLVPNGIRSRYTSIANMLSMGGMPIGSLIVGIILDKFPYHYLLIGINLLLIIVYGVFLLNACEQVYEPQAVICE